MLTVAEAGEPQPDLPGLDAGALAVGIACSWARAGCDVLLVDADAHGMCLAERIGAATRTVLPPARRGLPSLMAARTAIGPQAVTRHCWHLAVKVPGSVRLLAAPTHPDGARASAAWLAERAEQLATLAALWPIVVSMPGQPVDAYRTLGAAATQRVALAGSTGTAPPGGLRAVLNAFGFGFGPDPVTLLFEPSDAVGDTGAAAADRRFPGAGRGLPGCVGPVNAVALLGGRVRRRDRTPLASIDAAAGRLRGLSDQSAKPSAGKTDCCSVPAGHDKQAHTRAKARVRRATTAGGTQ